MCMWAAPGRPDLVRRGGGSRDDEIPKEKAGAFTSGCAGGKYTGPGDGDPSPMGALASSLPKNCLGAPAPTADVAKVNAGSEGNLALYCLPNEELIPLGRLRGGAKAILTRRKEARRLRRMDCCVLRAGRLAVVYGAGVGCRVFWVRPMT